MGTLAFRVLKEKDEKIVSLIKADFGYILVTDQNLYELVDQDYYFVLQDLQLEPQRDSDYE